MTPRGSFKVSDAQRWKCLWAVRTICMRWYVQNFVGRYFYERTLFEADDQCQKHQLGLNYHSGWKKLGPLKSGTDRKFSDLPNGLQGRHETGGVLSLFSRLSFDISIQNSVQRWSSDFEGLFRVKIRKMAQGSDDLSTLPLNVSMESYSYSRRRMGLENSESRDEWGLCELRTSYEFLLK